LGSWHSTAELRPLDDPNISAAPRAVNLFPPHDSPPEVRWDMHRCGPVPGVFGYHPAGEGVL